MHVQVQVSRLISSQDDPAAEYETKLLIRKVDIDDVGHYLSTTKFCNCRNGLLTSTTFRKH